MKPDWRAQNAHRTKGARLRRASYKSQNQTWEHEHCVGCWAKFMENGPTEALLAGYVTVDGDNWICPNCFDELHDEMDWTLIDP